MAKITNLERSELVVVTLLQVLNLSKLARVPLLLLRQSGIQRFLQSSDPRVLCKENDNAHNRFRRDLEVVAKRVHVKLPQQRFLPRQLVRVAQKILGFALLVLRWRLATAALVY
jgi:hypothetical protein